MATKSEHDDDIATLLPFYVNGTLSEQERARVDARLKHDKSMRDEVDFLRALRDEIRSTDADYSPADLGLARLMRSVEPANVPVRPRSAPRLVAASFAAAALTAGVMMFVRSDDESARYVQAGAAGAGPTLVVAFQPDAREGDISRLLLAHDLIVVDGPSALGLYRLALPDAGQSETLIPELESQSRIIESVSLSE